MVSIWGAGHFLRHARTVLTLYPAARLELDLLVTDLVMPGVHGDSLARGLVRDRPGLAVLYISGYTESVLTERGVLQEGHRLLRKPFTPDELVAAVAEALDAAPAIRPDRVAASRGLR
jgi:CheY-like chemotaxis protein